ncbi:TetR/AcrR family transcriptional regulator [Streptomyces sp. NPDC046977]|uniref:TetR/AcrR family transcriptional regulator n=1 Tax=Streptomyces sp. NPDC046977 TaxID=3154703 RepID=UPI00340D6C9B
MPTARNQYHHGNLRAAILTEAQTMLSESGADALSLREVARRTGVSHGAPRRHFPDKQALLSALVEQGYEQLGARIESALADTGGDFTERLTAFACAYVDFTRRNDELMTLMLSSKTWPDAGRLIAANERAFAPAVELLRQAAETGDIAAADTDNVNTAVLAMLHGLAFVAGHGLAGTGPATDLVAGAVRVLVEGLRPR